MNPVPPNIG